MIGLLPCSWEKLNHLCYENRPDSTALYSACYSATLLREAWSKGAVLSGVSAGMICWFRGGVTDSYGGLEGLNDGLGFIDATACPHYDNEPERRPTYHRVVADGLRSGYAADDGAALHFCGSQLIEVVSSRPEAGAYRVEFVEGRVIETPLPVRFLGAVD
jgi:dipeptidase E